jgi:23S rRNA (guanosine2251-2'-O)-methyltransferase
LPSPKKRPSGRQIVGRNPVLEALKAGTAIEQILLAKDSAGRGVEEIRALAQRRGIPVRDLERREFFAQAPDRHAQGVLAFAAQTSLLELSELVQQSKAAGEPGFLILPDQIEDPGNLGALIRTAECAGAHGLILTRHHSASLSPGTSKASAGATEYLPIAGVSNLVYAITELKEHGFWVVGLDMKGDRIYTGVDYSGPIAIVVGSEGRGIRRLVREHCDFLVRIPTLGKISSLNASAAGAVLMYEVRRQRNALQG